MANADLPSAVEPAATAIPSRNWRRVPSVRILFSDAKRFENDVEDVLDVGGAGNQVEGAKGVVEVQQEQFVVCMLIGRISGLGETCD